VLSLSKFLSKVDQKLTRVFDLYLVRLFNLYLIVILTYLYTVSSTYDVLHHIPPCLLDASKLLELRKKLYSGTVTVEEIDQIAADFLDGEIVDWVSNWLSTVYPVLDNSFIHFF
jgi:hypothetical protein